MPTVLREGPYRVYFYSHETGEPPHVHVDRDNASAKFWLNRLSTAANDGFSARELRVVEELVSRNRWLLIRAWNDFFGT
jgi:hypothetical protein